MAGAFEKDGQKQALQAMFNRSKSAYQVNRMRELMNFGKKKKKETIKEGKEGDNNSTSEQLDN